MMKNFRRYNSIENSYRNKFVEKIILAGVTDEYVATEKIHGANFSFIVDGNKKVSVAKRSGIIKENEDFFDWKEMLAKYKLKIIDLYLLIEKLTKQKDFTMIVYGEHYGAGIQKGIQYSDKKEFICFDILVSFDDGTNSYKSDEAYVPYKTMRKMCDDIGIPVVPEIARGKLDDMLDLNVDFNTKLNPIEDNVAEGVVIRHMSEDWLPSGKRIVLKRKNAKFAEKEHVKKEKTPLVLTEPQKELFEMVSAYVTENRLNNVISHIGEVTIRDVGKIIGLMNKDIIADFMKDKEIDLKNERKDDWKIITKLLGKEVSSMVRNYFIEKREG